MHFPDLSQSFAGAPSYQAIDPVDSGGTLPMPMPTPVPVQPLTPTAPPAQEFTLLGMTIKQLAMGAALLAGGVFAYKHFTEEEDEDGNTIRRNSGSVRFMRPDEDEDDEDDEDDDDSEYGGGGARDVYEQMAANGSRQDIEMLKYARLMEGSKG